MDQMDSNDQMNEIRSLLEEIKPNFTTLSKRFKILEQCFSTYDKNKVNKDAFYNEIKPVLIFNVKYIHRFTTYWKSSDTLIPHSDLLRFIYKDNEELSMELMHLYPKAYSTIQEPWTEWLAIYD